MNQNDQPATRHDVEEIVGRVVSDVVNDATDKILTTVGDQMSIVINQLDEIQSDTNHIRNKLDSTADKVDDHAVRLVKLEKQQA